MSDREEEKKKETVHQRIELHTAVVLIELVCEFRTFYTKLYDTSVYEIIYSYI